MSRYSGFLVGLRDDHQIVEVVHCGVTTKEVDDREKFFRFVLFEGVLHNPFIRELALSDRGAEAGDGAMVAEECIEFGLQLRAVLTNRPGDLAALADDEICAWDRVGKNFGPYGGFVIVDDGIGKQARVTISIRSSSSRLSSIGLIAIGLKPLATKASLNLAR